MAKKKDTMITRIRKNTVRWFTRNTALDVRNFEPAGHLPSDSSEADDVSYLLDFRDWSAGGRGDGLVQNDTGMRLRAVVNPTPITETQLTGASSEDESSEQPLVPLVVRPKDVLGELDRKPDPFTLDNLDEKIALLRQKQAFVKSRYPKQEIDDLLERLLLRKKYASVAGFFEQFECTTDQFIQAFLAKYNLVLKSSEIFIPDFPKEAIDVMEAYTKEVQALCGKKPHFFVIATQDSFRETYDKRDPILLAQSPFGFYYYILGAWDEEMLNVHEL